VVTRAAEAVGVPLAQVGDVELVADAAFHLRYRELTAQRHRDEVADAIAAARARGDTWVVVAESGRQDAPALQPYQRIEMRLADGWALSGWIDVDPHTLVPVHGLEELRLDPRTGAVTDAAKLRGSRPHETRAGASAGASAQKPAAAETFPTREQWEAAWDRHRERAPR
jgi:hypothetical protein